MGDIGLKLYHDIARHFCRDYKNDDIQNGITSLAKGHISIKSCEPYKHRH